MKRGLDSENPHRRLFGINPAAMRIKCSMPSTCCCRCVPTRNSSAFGALFGCAALRKEYFELKNNPLLSKPFGQSRNQAPTKVTFCRPRRKTLGFRRVFGFMMLIICASAASLLLALRISESGSLVSGDTVDSAAVFSPLRFASNNSPDDAAKAMTRVRQVGFSLFSCLQF